jgi:hypothetical protein
MTAKSPLRLVKAEEPRGAGNEPKRERTRGDGCLPPSKWHARQPRRTKGWRKDQLRWPAHYRNALDPGLQVALFDIDRPDRLGPITEGTTA